MHSDPILAICIFGPIYVKLNNNRTEYSRPASFSNVTIALSPNFTDFIYFLRYYDLFNFTLVRWAKWINRNISQNRHKGLTIKDVRSREDGRFVQCGQRKREFFGCECLHFWCKKF